MAALVDSMVLLKRLVYYKNYQTKTTNAILHLRSNDKHHNIVIYTKNSFHIPKAQKSLGQFQTFQTFLLPWEPKTFIFRGD